MSAFPPDFDRIPAAPATEKVERPAPPRREEPKKTSWFYVFEQWISAPAGDEDEFVLA